jgi:3',5'-cyclic AMP phosphodiesterase CpdA
MKFIHISDLHFHRRKKDNKDAVKLLKLIEQQYPAHYLVVTGDITDDGDAEQFRKCGKTRAGCALSWRPKICRARPMPVRLRCLKEQSRCRTCRLPDSGPGFSVAEIPQPGSRRPGPRRAFPTFNGTPARGSWSA